MASARGGRGVRSILREGMRGMSADFVTQGSVCTCSLSERCRSRVQLLPDQRSWQRCFLCMQCLRHGAFGARGLLFTHVQQGDAA